MLRKLSRAAYPRSTEKRSAHAVWTSPEYTGGNSREKDSSCLKGLLVVLHIPRPIQEGCPKCGVVAFVWHMSYLRCSLFGKVLHWNLQCNAGKGNQPGVLTRTSLGPRSGPLRLAVALRPRSPKKDHRVA